jgi:hypothetical protein
VTEYYEARDGTKWLTPEERDAWEYPLRREAHLDRARELLRKADEWIDVDEETLTERGYGMAQVWIGLADLHLRIRDLI